MLKLQIVDESGVVVRLPAGGVLEQDLIESCVAAIGRRPIGLFTTTAQVEQAIRAGMREAIHALKAQTVRL